MTITAKIIADSSSTNGFRLTTLQLRYPKFIHGEFMTHRVFSRNASSSRAIPVDRLIKDVLDDPAMPIHWGKNQKGMQADEQHDAPVVRSDDYVFSTPQDAWLAARDAAVERARAFTKAGYHKQIVNRLIEPYCHINVVVTSTQWSNFFALRDHPDAQPEIRVLAQEMKKALNESTPVSLHPDQWHTPYVESDETEMASFTKVKLSVARCARVSYLTQEGKKPDIGQDLDLYNRLLASVPLHASPAEHQATPDTYDSRSHHWNTTEQHGNFSGWIQFRKTLPGECQ